MYAIRAERGACRPGGMRHVTSGRNAARAIRAGCGACHIATSGRTRHLVESRGRVSPDGTHAI